MWIIENNSVLSLRSNSPFHNIIESLRSEFPLARILRSRLECINDVNALIFAETHVEGELLDVEETVLDEHGEPMLNDDGSQMVHTAQVRGPSTVTSAGNTYDLLDDTLVIRDKAGAELARFELEVVHEPSS